jgi:hypothetical protein
VKFILSFCSAVDLARVARVNKKLHNIVEEMPCALVLPVDKGIPDNPDAYDYGYLRGSYSHIRQVLNYSNLDDQLSRSLVRRKALISELFTASGFPNVAHFQLINEIISGTGNSSAALKHGIDAGLIGLFLGMIPQIYFGNGIGATLAISSAGAFIAGIATTITMFLYYDREELIKEKHESYVLAKKMSNNSTGLLMATFSMTPPSDSPLPVVMYPFRPPCRPQP